MNSARKTILATSLILALISCAVPSAKADSFSEFKEHREATVNYFARTYSQATKLIERAAMGTQERDTCAQAMRDADKYLSEAISREDLTKADRALAQCDRVIDAIKERAKKNNGG